MKIVFSIHVTQYVRYDPRPAIGKKMPVRLVNCRDSLAACKDAVRQSVLKYIKTVTPPRRLDTSAYINKRKNQDDMTPEEKVRAFMVTMHSGFFKNMNFLQTNMFNVAFQAILPPLVGDKWEVAGTYINRCYNITENNPFMLFSAARRMGKTFFIAYYVICCAYYIPGNDIAVFATCLRISIELQKTVIFILMQSKKSHWVESFNCETVKIVSYNGRISVINFYPCNPTVSVYISVYIFIV
ncbi:MAG: hypothetical protein JSS82_00305 [Bacteroidetes bacterium]|nr:hypothetical protein [Bacteroidota bacterium]